MVVCRLLGECLSIDVDTKCIYIMDIEFEWDTGKSQSNIAKHGVSFELASKIFEGPHFTKDGEWLNGEFREISIGLAEGTVVLVVVHTDRDEKVRIISARKATRSETDRFYEEIGKTP